MKNLLALLLFMGAILFAYALLSHAATGRDVFLNQCGACHGRGKEADVFAPTKYAASQWERFFKRNKHQRKKDISDRFSESELIMVKEYLVEHAADSDRPEAIGLR